MQWLVDRLELSRGSENNTRPMEGLRGVAVFLVFLVHFATLSTPWFVDIPWVAATANSIRAIGNAGVDLFFVLSGYLIYGTLMRRAQPFGEFMVRRVRRIYPAFLVVFAVYIALGIAVPSLNKLPTADRPQYLLANLLLLPGLFPIKPLITVAWSLSYELFFYLTIPIFISGTKLRTWQPASRIWALIAMAGTMLAYCAAAAGPVGLAMFFAGMLLHELLAFTNRRPSASLALIAACAAVILRIVPTDGSLGYTLKMLAVFIGFGLLCWSCLAQPGSWLGFGLSWTPLRWLGNISYSYYLAHSLALVPSFMAVNFLLPGTQSGVATGVLLLPAMFAVTLVPSLLLYLAIERPLSLVVDRRDRQRL